MTVKPTYAPDGGPAFPILNTQIGYNADIRMIAGGMSLRDYFAGQYIAGVFAGEPGSHLRTDRAAIDAYELADAMIIARAKGGVV